MTAIPFDGVVSWVGSRLLLGSVETVVLVSLVWIACRRINLTASQAALWWLAALKVVVVLLPLPAVTLPVLPATTTVPVGAADESAGRTPAEAVATPAVPGVGESSRVLKK